MNTTCKTTQNATTVEINCITQVSCPNGTYYNQTNDTCVTCVPGCSFCNATKCITNCAANCSDCITSTCLACQPKYTMVDNYLFSNKCLNTTCDAYGLFLNSTTKACDTCGPYCDQCSSASNCLSCSKGYWLVNATVKGSSANTCTQQCPMLNQFQDSISKSCN